MIKTIEDSRAEFKVKLVDDLEESVIAFLNKDGGNIYIGVNDNGNVVGLKNNMDLLQRKVKDKIISGVEPSVLGLFDLENDSLLINNDHSNEANNAYKLVCSIPIQLLNSVSFYIEEINEKTNEKDLSIAYRKYLERIAVNYNIDIKKNIWQQLYD